MPEMIISVISIIISVLTFVYSVLNNRNNNVVSKKKLTVDAFNHFQIDTLSELDKYRNEIEEIRQKDDHSGIHSSGLGQKQDQRKQNETVQNTSQAFYYFCSLSAP